MNDRTITVAAVAFQENRVLLVKHGEKAHHLTGVYGLPGGRLDSGENLLDGAAREFEEETGLTPEKDSMIKIPVVYEADILRKSGEILKTSWNVFIVKQYSGNLVRSDETEPEWVGVENVSLLNILPNTEEAIREAIKILGP